MRITWVTGSPLEQTGGRWISSSAGVRLRILQPVEALSHPAFSHKLLTLTGEAIDASVEPYMDADIVVFSKCMSSLLLERARAHGARVIFDICDNHFEREEVEQQTRWSANAADLITCNSEAMRDLARGYAPNVPCLVIPEAYECPRGEPRFERPAQTLDLLWFGHISNFRYVQEWIRAFRPGACPLPIRLAMLTTLLEPFSNACAQLNKQDIGLSLYPLEWSLKLQWRALAECHAVLLPSEDHFYTRTKSPNRVVESLWAGRFVLAHPLPSYQPFAPWTWQGQDLYEGIRWMLEHPEEIAGKIRQAQQYIEHHHAPSEVAKLWERAFTRVK